MSESPLPSRPQLLSLLLRGLLFPQPLDQREVKADACHLWVHSTRVPRARLGRGQVLSLPGALRLRLSLVALSRGMRGMRVAGYPWGSGADARARPWQTRLGPGASQWASCPSQQGWLLLLKSSHAACSSLPQQPACCRP